MHIPNCTHCGRDKQGPNPLCWHCAENCPHNNWIPMKIRKANGLEEPRLRCERCGRAKSAGKNRDWDMASLPLLRDHVGSTPACEVCGAPDTERHHFAPVALFGHTEAERWPKAWLCRSCHTTWHRVINAGATRRP